MKYDYHIRKNFYCNLYEIALRHISSVQNIILVFSVDLSNLTTDGSDLMVWNFRFPQMEKYKEFQPKVPTR